MKIRIACVLLLSVCCNLCLAQVTVPNAGMEQADANEASGSMYWKIEGHPDKCFMDTVTAKSGKSSVYMQKTASQGVTGFFQRIPYHTAELKKYRISAAIKIKNVAHGYAGVSVRAIDSAGRLICHQNLNMADDRIRGTRDWKIYEGEFYTTEQTAMLRIAGFLYGSGEAWYDDIRIEEIPMGKGKIPKRISAYMDNYFSVIDKYSIVQDKAFIAGLRKRAETLYRGHRDMNYCHFILKGITFNLNDGHSFFSTPLEWKEIHEGSKNLATGDAGFSKGYMLKEGIAYISIPTFASIDWNIVKQNVDTLQQMIAGFDSLKPKGWIIDLSSNRGGNSFAMFPGLGPLIGNGVCGYSISADGSKRTLYYTNGLAGWNENLDTMTKTPYTLKHAATRIAVIYGNSTGSSGEVTALTLRGLDNSRSFGQPTGGATTRVDNFIMSDKASINLAAGYDADRNGIVFKGTPIPPDVLTKDHDEALQKAIAWILE